MIDPGQTLGILGGGHLARLYALAARRLGYTVHIYDPCADTTDIQVADRVFRASYLDAARMDEFAQGCQAITFVSEEIPVTQLQKIEASRPITPHWSILHICQHSERERVFLKTAGFPCPPFVPVRSAEELAGALQTLGLPCAFLASDLEANTAPPIRIESAPDPAALWARLGARSAILEPAIDTAAELCMHVVRRRSGEVALYPLAEHPGGDTPRGLWIVPARCAPQIEERARKIAADIAERLKLVGALAVGFLADRDGELVVKHIAPRPHSSALYTVDACLTDQFSQALRATCDLPLGRTDLLSPSATLPFRRPPAGEGPGPAWDRLLERPLLKLHLYGPPGPREDAPAGHLTVLSETVDDAMATALQALADAGCHPLAPA